MFFGIAGFGWGYGPLKEVSTSSSLTKSFVLQGFAILPKKGKVGKVVWKGLGEGLDRLGLQNCKEKGAGKNPSMYPGIVLQLLSPGGPKRVSTKAVSMKRPNFPYFRAFYTVVSKGNFQKSP